MRIKKFETKWAGKTLTAEFSDLADQTNGSCIIRYGNTVVLATVVLGNLKEGLDYFPLTVDYEEKFYASGQILGSQFMRREGRPSSEAIIRGRIIDRTIRPLFSGHIRNEVQVIITTLAIDEDDPDILAILAASLALGTSNIPWNGPVGSVRIARKRGEKEWMVNPTFANRPDEKLDFEMICCGKSGNINMIEVEAGETTEKEVVEAFNLAGKYIGEIEDFQKKIIKEIDKEKIEFPKVEFAEEGLALFKAEIEDRIEPALFSGPGKEKIDALLEEWAKLYAEKFPEKNHLLALDHFEENVNNLLHKEAIENKRRPDGRKLDEVRKLFAKAGGVSPALHGSGIFYRGGTHIFTALTLGGPDQTLHIDSPSGKKEKRFMHHYNFPPYSSGETGKVGNTNRRMIGHGMLAEKAMRAVLPEKEQFPYTIRLVSESMASNGSTSMASVCGSSLALMDGGVPIKTPVAGIASGLMLEKPTTSNQQPAKYRILTDIQGPEDHHGDMDFKVAGTKNGVTAIQLDVKVDGIPINILSEALEAARLARLHILETITVEIAEPRKTLSPRAPEIMVIKIKPDQIGLIIGSGGKTINEIRELTSTEIQVEDDGTVYITGKNGGAGQAKQIIEEMTREYTRGDRFEGLVTKILDFGAFVKIGHSTEGLVHISEIAPFRIEKVTEVLHEGMLVPVKVKEIDDRGRINLSIKMADPSFAEKHGAKPKSPPPSNTGSNSSLPPSGLSL